MRGSIRWKILSSYSKNKYIRSKTDKSRKNIVSTSFRINGGNYQKNYKGIASGKQDLGMWKRCDKTCFFFFFCYEP